MRNIRKKFKGLLEKEGTVSWKEFLAAATEGGLTDRNVARRMFMEAIVDKIAFRPSARVDVTKMTDVDMEFVFSSLKQLRMIGEDAPDKMEFTGGDKRMRGNAESLVRIGAFLREDKYFPPDRNCVSTRFKPGEIDWLIEDSKRRHIFYGTRGIGRRVTRTPKWASSVKEKDLADFIDSLEGTENETVYRIGVVDDDN